MKLFNWKMLKELGTIFVPDYKAKWGIQEPFRPGSKELTNSLNESLAPVTPVEVILWDIIHAMGQRLHELELHVHRKNSKKKPGRGIAVWNAYELVYAETYKTQPVRNAMVNKICTSMVDRLGQEQAVNVVIFYLKQRDAFYVRNAHHLKFCLADCETLHTKMESGFKITRSQAQSLETASHNSDVTTEYLQKKHGKA